MVHIAPFKGILYNQKRVGDLELVTAPPYDAISVQQQEALYNKSPYNVIRLILNREEGDKKYEQANAFFRQWINEGILEEAKEPALYIYEQKYFLSKGEKAKNKPHIRRGIVARAGLEDFASGKILPHEHTHQAAKTDRMKLMQASHANFCQIFSFYSEQDGVIDHYLDQTVKTKAPLIDFKDEHEIEHLVWELTDPPVIKIIGTQIEKCPIFIADGHHRYETSLAYRDLCRQNDPGWNEEKAYNYTMMMLINMDDADLTILPIHRLIRHLHNFDLHKFIGMLKEFFNLREFELKTDNQQESLDYLLSAMHNHDGRHRFGLYGGNNRLYLLTLKDKNILSQLSIGSKSEHWKQLDVAVLHSTLIDHVLKAGQLEWGENNITYTIDPLQALHLVEQGQYQLAVFLNPTKLEQVREIAKAGEKMPQKSTFFYPKLLSGLIFNRFED